MLTDNDVIVREFVYGTANGPRLTTEDLFPSGPQPAANSPLSESPAQREIKAREEGILEGEQRARAAFAQEIQAARDTVAQAVQQFAQSRDVYFHQVEGDVVRLALSIAAKILHREAQIEPLLLKGAVHVALEKLGANTKARLRVSPAKDAAWRHHFAANPPSGIELEIASDPSLKGEECVLETQVGDIELDAEARLNEIEQGFFDLLARRPAIK
jgi:flagellar assembly protein FliH